jgi:pilus assembly protein Flp/PilA
MWKKAKNQLKAFVEKEDGQGFAEYGLILVGIAIVVIVVVKLLGSRLQNTFQRIVNEL